MLSHIKRNGQLADDDGEGQQGPREQSHPQVGEDDLEEDGDPVRPQALGRLGQRPDVHRSQPVVDRAEHVGKREGGVHADEEDPRAVVGGSQQQRRPAVEADDAEHQHDRRDHERQQRDEFDDRSQLWQSQCDPVGGGNDDQQADEDGGDGIDDRLAEGRQEVGVGEQPSVGLEAEHALLRPQ